MTTAHADRILVLGGTGKTGRRVVRRLREAGRTVRAVDAGVRRFVALSGRGIEHAAGGDFGQGMIAAEQAVRGSGVEWTIIRPNNFDHKATRDDPRRRRTVTRRSGTIRDVDEDFARDPEVTRRGPAGCGPSSGRGGRRAG
ncbi:SDR family oxidoreductase [Planomonospora sp. ID82291]|uniref:SDR family oxidoreductase n=1 Tax=Planomonospora sp. ID82291 TaxID=2738136 RepID=UPI00210562DA|nr:NAD(P)H-binding protein [Planomonospora sp. ID82291]